jgi:hypothetical protein
MYKEFNNTRKTTLLYYITYFLRKRKEKEKFEHEINEKIIIRKQKI